MPARVEHSLEGLDHGIEVVISEWHFNSVYTKQSMRWFTPPTNQIACMELDTVHLCCWVEL